jgi:outer membrane receptor protein involved in Fe transport
MPRHSDCRSAGAGAYRAARWSLALATAGAVHGLGHASTTAVDLAALPIEQLLTIEVYSASKFVQTLTDAPSAVSVVTAAEIKAFGWRTLADILGSMRGLYLGNDRNYSYLGARGFLRPGDYNTRFLLLVDGNRTNDAVYDQAAIGTEFVLDVDLIERVEYVPGPGSSIYGANALFGVVNVITKSGRALNGPQVALEAGSHGTGRLRASYGVQTDDGAILVSATSYRKRGRNLYFPEFDSPGDNHGLAQRLDHDRAESLFVKGTHGPFSLSLAHSARKKGIPTASFSQVFNDPRSHTDDVLSLVDFGHRYSLAVDRELSTRVYWGAYDYDGDYVYDFPPVGINRDVARARWWGAEARLTSTRLSGHKLVFGAEYQHDYRRDQFNYDVGPHAVLLDDRRSGRRMGVYAQDEIVLGDSVLLNAGLRYDRNSSTGGTFSPRLGLIYKAREASTLKALYGTAFRAPNAYELFYEIPGAGGQRSNPALQAERVRSVELIAEQRLARDARLSASVFHNTVSGLISQTLDPAQILIFQNMERVVARGAELEFEKAWRGGMRLRTSVTLQRAHHAHTGEELVNSPRRLAKFNFTTPLLEGSLRAGLDLRHVSQRRTLAASTHGYWIANLTLSAVRLGPGLEASASIYNLFNRRYADPGGEEHAQDAIRQDGRSLRARLSYTF